MGLSSNFLGNRIFFDFAYFRQISSDFIIKGGMSETTGFSSAFVNFGEERLRDGYELTDQAGKMCWMRHS
ncbi:hypothetical protein AwDysgo_08870 [Bacteroidales bacterium]|nr:hypothetical protein AwDysgo_08870 [Bacteroidales bacterium]